MTCSSLIVAYCFQKTIKYPHQGHVKITWYNFRNVIDDGRNDMDLIGNCGKGANRACFLIFSLQEWASTSLKRLDMKRLDKTKNSYTDFMDVDAVECGERVKSRCGPGSQAGLFPFSHLPCRGVCTAPPDQKCN